MRHPDLDGRRPALCLPNPSHTRRPAPLLSRSLACAFVVALAWTQPGCKHRQVAERQTVEESGAPTTTVAPTLSSTVHMGDPKAANQLIAGFYDIESRAWRWSKRQFSVNLRPPPGAAQKGAILTLNLTLPPVVIETDKSITLTASVNGTKIVHRDLE